jgi:hypothetical protein
MGNSLWLTQPNSGSPQRLRWACLFSLHKLNLAVAAGQLLLAQLHSAHFLGGVVLGGRCWMACEGEEHVQQLVVQLPTESPQPGLMCAA